MLRFGDYLACINGLAPRMTGVFFIWWLGMPSCRSRSKVCFGSSIQVGVKFDGGWQFEPLDEQIDVGGTPGGALTSVAMAVSRRRRRPER